MEVRLKYKGIALITSTLFFIYSHVAYGLCVTKLLPNCMPIYEDMTYHSVALLLGMWASVGRYEFAQTKFVKPITVCFHITISYVFGELLGVAHGHFSLFGLVIFGIMLVVLILLTLQRESLKWNYRLKKHKYLYLFVGWMLTF